MVTKSRTRSYLRPVLVDDKQVTVSIDSVSESMSDSSTSGSARTEVDAVDKFMSNPTTHTDFVRALQASSKSPGDAGLADFRVQRVRSTYGRTSGIWHTFAGGPIHTVTDFAMRTPSGSEFPSLTPYVEPTRAQLKAKGQELYLQALPNRDQAQLGTLLGEIVSNPVRAMALPGKAALQAARRQVRLVPGRQKALIQSRHRRISELPLEDARAAADDYLAYIFGVRPTVQDLDRLAESISSSRKIAEKVSRTAGKRIRRRRVDPPRERRAYKITPNTWTLAMSNGNSMGLRGTRVAVTESIQENWFSAGFRQTASETDDWLGRCSTLFKTLDRITGLGLDVKVAWDLIPFSFIVDWFANTGDFLENRQVIADYNIVCEYGYQMCHTRLLKTMTATGQLGKYAGIVDGSAAVASYHYLVETKIRTSSGSIGFATDIAALNGYQWSALTALGLSAHPGVPPRRRV